MRLTALFTLFCFVSGQTLALNHAKNSSSPSPSGISETTYRDLVRYTKYSSGAYQLVCLKPLGNTLVQTFANIITGTRGFIARDDTRKEIVVAFRGSMEAGNIFTDAAILLVPLETPGVNAGDARVHLGFLDAYNDVVRNVLSVVEAQLRAHPNYILIAVGHSLGGAVASICGLSLKSNFPEENVKVYTFGQPRTGNTPYALLVEETLGISNVFRAVHTFDGVPTIITRKFGYTHHATEYWQFAEPASAGNVKRCEVEEDLACSRSILSTGINIAHMIYFGQAMTVDPRVCM